MALLSAPLLPLHRLRSPIADHFVEEPTELLVSNHPLNDGFETRKQIIVMANRGIWRENKHYVSARDRVKQIWGNLRKNGLWKRMIKNIIATTAAGKPLARYIPLSGALFG